MTIAKGIYLLSAVTSLVAAWLLLRYYVARRTALLLWSCLGFAGLALTNVLVYADLVTFPEIDLALLRAAVGATSMLVLLFGLIWETRA